MCGKEYMTNCERSMDNNSIVTIIPTKSIASKLGLVKVWFQNRRMKKKKLQSRNHNPTGNNNGITGSLLETGNDITGKESVEYKTSDSTIEEYDEDSVRSEKFKMEHEFLNLSSDIYSNSSSCFIDTINDYESNHPSITDISNNNNKLYNRMKFNKFSHELFPPFYYNSSIENNLMNSEFNFNPVNMNRDLLFDPLKESLKNQLFKIKLFNFRRLQQRADVHHNQLHKQHCLNINQSEICDSIHSNGSYRGNDSVLQLTEHNLSGSQLNKTDLSLGNQMSLTRIQSSLLHVNPNCLSKTCTTESYSQKPLNCNENFNTLPQLNSHISYDSNESTVDLTTNTAIATNINTPTSIGVPSRGRMNIMNYNLNPFTVNDSDYYMGPVESNHSYTLNLDCSPISHYSFLPTLTTTSTLETQLTTCWPPISTSTTNKYLSPPPGSYPLQSTNPDTAVSATVSDDIDQNIESFSSSIDHDVSFRKDIFRSVKSSTADPNNCELDQSNLSYLPTSMNVYSAFSKGSHNSNQLNFSDSNDSCTFSTYTSQLNSSCNMNTNETINSYLPETNFHLITDRSQDDNSIKQNPSLTQYSIPSSTNLSPIHHLNNVFNQVNHGDFNSMFYSPYLHNTNSFGYSIAGHDMLSITDSYNPNVLNNLTQSINQSFNQSTTNIAPVNNSSSGTFPMNTTIHLSNLCNTTNINNVTLPFPMISTNTHSLDLSST
ncbi:LOW QUALITY PROTEIN: homeobox-containing protein,putative [Schistosoma mansoni]|uniref:homeobox-containing protein,putative n=1 Tax=Schistosoma mansoni TaxID=6183 RepID=UPI00022C8280|nr:LOW QUALITY PROTEIN: homeobox-containing protein,putative [Schistosoma mansoni]|eukprot:XP_018646778.1 LOW QUALITY PROTEIN: homeobox-containing protein,putative [Schistosoma mansoni]